MDLKEEKRQAWVTIFVFCALLFGFTAAAAAKPSKGFSETENRILAQRPKITAETVLDGEFEADYEKYLTDQFFGRDAWIGLKTFAERLLLKSESKDIYFGRDGYLIEKHTGSFDTDLARQNGEQLAAFVRQYEPQFGKGHVSVMLVPNAVDMLLNELPPYADSGKGAAYLEQVSGQVPEGIWFDTMLILQAHAGEELYYRTDHHWKTRAAFYVYQAWAAMRGYGVAKLSDYEIQTVTTDFEGTIQSKLGIRTGGDTIELFLPKHAVSYAVLQENGSVKSTLYDDAALDTKDQYAVYFGGNEAFVHISTEADSTRKILVLKDSYANCFIPFLIGEFREIDLVDLRYSRERLSERINGGAYTDLLVLYNVSGFAEDTNIGKLGH